MIRISDVADFINECPDYESEVISNMAVHRAVSVFLKYWIYQLKKKEV